MRHNVGISRLSIEYIYILPNDPGTMSGEFRVQNYRLKKKITEASLAVCILDQLSKYNLTMQTNQKNMRYPDHQHQHQLQKWKFLFNRKIKIYYGQN